MKGDQTTMPSGLPPGVDPLSGISRKSSTRRLLGLLAQEHEALEEHISQIQTHAGKVRQLIDDSLYHAVLHPDQFEAKLPFSSAPTAKVNTRLAGAAAATKPDTESEEEVVFDPDEPGEEVNTRLAPRFEEEEYMVFNSSVGGNATPKKVPSGPTPAPLADLSSTNSEQLRPATTTTTPKSRSNLGMGGSSTKSTRSINRPRLLDIFGECGSPALQTYMREDMVAEMSFDLSTAERKKRHKRARTGDLRIDRESRFQWMVVRPSSAKRIAWDVLSTVLVLYDLFLIPFEVFNPPFTLAIVIIDWITTIFWILDMCFSCLTGYYEEGVVEMQLSKILKRYLHSWFVLDCSAVSVDVVIIVLGTNFHAASVLRFSKTARLIRVLRLLRLARVKKLHHALNELFDKVQSEYCRIFVRVGLLMVSLIILNHYIACSWYGIADGNWFNFDITWLTEHDTPTDRDEQSKLYWYTTSLHWSLTQFTPASMEVHAVNTTERSFSVLVLLFALVAFSSFLSSITASMTHLRELQKEWLRQESALRKYFVQNQISAELGHCILKYFQGRRHSKNRWRIVEDDMPILRMLPGHLMTRIHEELYSPSLLCHPFFEQYAIICHAGMSELCHRCVSMRHVTDGETLFFEAEVSEKMYFITRGVMQYHRTFGREAKSMTTVEGSWCCELALWMHWWHCGRLISQDSTVELLVIDGEACRKVLLSDYHSVARDIVALYAKLNAEHVLSMPPDQLSDLNPSAFALEALMLSLRDGIYGRMGPSMTTSTTTEKRNSHRSGNVMSPASSFNVKVMKWLSKGS